MKLQTKALIFQFLCFALLFVIFRFLIAKYANLDGIWIPLTAFVVGTILCPQFKAIRTPDGEKLYVKWIFLKGARKIG